MNLLLALRGVSLGYDRGALLSDLDLEIHRGDYLGIVGPNGSGKTTILRGLLGLLPPLRGRIERAREDLRFGYVPQRQTLDDAFPLTSHQVACMGRYHAAGRRLRLSAADRDLAHRALVAAGVDEKADTLFRNLSGGQRQRVLLARALATEPDVLVLDEPTSGMDLGGTASILRLVERLRVERRLTVILVSHELDTVAQWVRTLGMLHDGQLEVGPVGELLTGDRLRRVYGPGADVVSVEGHHFIVPPGGES